MKTSRLSVLSALFFLSLACGGGGQTRNVDSKPVSETKESSAANGEESSNDKVPTPLVEAAKGETPEPVAEVAQAETPKPAVEELVVDPSKGKPEPKELKALAKYSRSITKEDAEQEQAHRWFQVDYRKTVLSASKGNKKALATLFSLRLDGSGAEAHSYTLDSLLHGLGDRKFSEVLKKQPMDVISAVLSDLDFLEEQEGRELDDPEHYRQTHRRTFKLGRH